MQSFRILLAAFLLVGLATCDDKPSEHEASEPRSAAATEETERSRTTDRSTAASEEDSSGAEPRLSPDDSDAPSDARPTAVFLLAGQSNMVGLGDVSELTTARRKTVDATTIWLDDSIHQNPKRKTWSPLAPGFGATPNHFGPELSFGRRLRETWPDRRIALIKVAEGGTTLQTDWRAREGRLYERLVDDVRRQMDVLNDEESHARLFGMAWMQGESDAHGAAAVAYEKHLREFVEALRADLNRPDLPVTIGLIAPIPRWRRHETIRAAQRSVAESLDHANTVETAGYSRHSDDPAHYDARGQLRLGENFADALLKLQP